MHIAEIREYLPHRYPFLFVDRVTELDLEKSYIKAYKNISINESLFEGHFPHHPIFPGVLITEAMAQTSGILGFKIMNVKPQDGHLYYFVGTDKLRLKRPVIPGDKLEIQSQVLQVKRNIWKFGCSASVEGKVVATADIICADQKI